MKKLLIVFMVIALASCGGDKSELTRKKIANKKNQIIKLENDIKKLEAQLTDSVKKSAIPVDVKIMAGEKFNHYIIAYGEVEAVNYARISPEMPGKIDEIYVNEGQKVKKGELLVSLNTELIDNSIKQIKTNLEFVVQTYEKQEKLWEQKIGSEMQYLQAKTSKESLESQLKSLEAQKKMAQIRAPFNGYIDKIYGKRGELASSMMPVLDFVDLNKLSISAEISESYIDNVTAGQNVEVTFSSVPNLAFQTPITWVSKVINKTNRTFEIELKLDNTDELIKPFMVSTIKIKDFSSDMAFVVPSLIIKQDITGKYLYTVKADGGKTVAEKTYIKPGLSYNDITMVNDGLKPNDKVITNGFNLVTSGLEVQIR